MAIVNAPPREVKTETKNEGAQLISKGVRARPLFDPEIVRRATKESFVKLNPRMVAKNPVMFVVEVGAALTTVFVIKDAVTGAGDLLFGIQIALWLWFTVLFANFAEAMAEARGKAQADNLRKTKTDTMARKILPNAKFEMVPASKLRAGDVVFVEAGNLIPGDGEVIEGIASVDESVKLSLLFLCSENILQASRNASSLTSRVSSEASSSLPYSTASRRLLLLTKMPVTVSSNM